MGLAEVQDAFVLRPEVQALMRKVRISAVDTVCPQEPTLAANDRVVIELDDGRVFDSGEIAETRGGLAQPLLPGELEAKFRDCTVSAGDGVARYRCLEHLEELPDVAELPRAG